MNQTTGTRLPDSAMALRQALMVLFLGATMMILLPNNQSLWIDEASTAIYARQASIGDLLSLLAEDPESESLMPLGMFWYWLGAKIVGTSEIALRTLSTAWVVLAMALILWAIPPTRGSLAFAFFACHPFVWYYGGEARPYAMQMAFGAGVLSAVPLLYRREEPPTRCVNRLCIFSPLLCASGLLCVVPAAVSVFGAAFVLALQKRLPTSRDWVKICCTGAALVVLAAYYLSKLATGAGGATGLVWRVGISNILFSAYEILGFTGFGPGRFDLRRIGSEAGIAGVIKGFSLPAILAIALLAIAYAATLVRFKTHILAERTSTAALVTAFCIYVILVSVGLLYVLSVAVGFPFWGRHLSPLLPFVVYVMGIINSRQRNHPFRRRWQVLPIAIVALLLASSLLVRFHPRHSRDDYRMAARTAMGALKDGDVVWWVAATNPATYYGLPLCEFQLYEETAACALSAVNLEVAQVAMSPTPDLVVVTKPDLFDDLKAVSDYVANPAFTMQTELHAFSIYRRDAR